ncbi:MFS transporter [Sphingomonas sp. AR_OL41]|uniref:spinster family MFS transporter n=1 Tax=Sphingomonas sp. AR_OL41 TaxID=3042729 RepID=UPI002480CFF5|nr:MFS transporter [Sphingomonas sp. AR_OL41]MDH7973238.1 MFS transporter [Sphingomonas sp. AR_OL41]
MTKQGDRTVALILLMTIYVFNFMDRQILGVLIEPIKHELHLSDSQLGLLTGFMFALFYTSFGIPLAWLADRTRRTWVIAGSCALWSGFSAACGLATGFGSLAAARIGVAVGEAGGVPPSYSLIADMFPPQRRARAIAIYSLGVPIGIGIGTATGGWIASLYGWRVAFFAVSAPGILLSLLLLALVREPARGQVNAAAGAHGAVSLPRAVALFVSSPALMLVSLAGGLGAFACYGLMAWISAYLIRVLGMNLGQIGLWLSLTLAGGLGAGIWASGVLTDRLAATDRRMFALIPAAALALGAPLLFAATILNDWRLALPVFGVTLALSVFYLAPTVAIVQQLVPPAQRSAASAMMLFCLNLIGLGCGPLFLGMVSDAALPAHGGQSLRVAFQALVPMFVLAALANLVAARVLARTPSVPEVAISGL